MTVVIDNSRRIDLERSELREVAGYPAACVRPRRRVTRDSRAAIDPARAAFPAVLRRHPVAPGGGRGGELLRQLDAALR